MKRLLIGLFLACLILSLFISCGKRDNPVKTRYLFHEVYRSSWRFPSLEDNIRGDLDEAVRDVFVYLPPIYGDEHQPELISEGFSVLYLLHDFWADYSTFVSVYKIAQIADQLIAEGQIQPMIIVMPDASSLFLASDLMKEEKGGTFYTNSILLGQYEDYIIRELAEIIDASFHTYLNKPEEVYIPDPRYRAISGLGMGGYGALRIAMDHDTLFSSVSAMSPFASFGSFLTRETIDKVFEENDTASNDFSYSRYKSLNLWEDPDHPDKTYSQLIFSMAAAFSPHDPADPDTTNFFTLAVEGGYGVDLPFDSTRTIVDNSPIWKKWLLHDLHHKLTLDHTAFGDLSIYLDCGDQNEFGLYDGTKAFSDLLSLYGKEHTYIKYSGYQGYPAGHDNFIHDRLVEILKFHSRNFPPPAYRGAE
jgi:S-formylglutathione hydrolase FrmB